MNEHTAGVPPKTLGPDITNVLLVGTGGIAVTLLPGWLMLLRSWYPIDVRVCLTTSASTLVSPLSVSSVSGHPVIGPDWNSGGAAVPHRELAEWTHLTLVIPATVTFTAKLALGILDSIALFTLAASTAPAILAPAGPANVITRAPHIDHVRALEDRGYHIAQPVRGMPAHGASMEQGGMANIIDVLHFTAARLHEGGSRA